MNRDLLAAILEDEYDIVQANDGVKAVDYLQKHAEELSLVLLDLVMPQMDGFEVLAYMNKEHWIDYIPVIIISAEDSPAYIKRGYEKFDQKLAGLGAIITEVDTDKEEQKFKLKVG